MRKPTLLLAVPSALRPFGRRPPNAWRKASLRAAVLCGALLVFGVGVAAAAPIGQITEFSNGLNPGAFLSGLTPGPDGNVWFPDSGTTPAIGRVSPAGVITEFALGPGSLPTVFANGITYGPDGNVWFTDQGTRSIGVIDPDTHAISEFSAGLNPGSLPFSITAGGDGNLWFTDRGTTKAIGVINPTTHAISEFSAGLNPGSLPGTLNFGPDGNVWFQDGGAQKAVARVDVTTHAISEFSAGLTTAGTSRPIPAPDGNLWFGDRAPKPLSAVGRITPDGVITEFQVTLSPGQTIFGAGLGADGNLWVLERTPAAIGRFDLHTHVLTQFTNGLSSTSTLGTIVTGADLNQWATDAGATQAIAQVGTGVCDGSREGCNLQGMNLENGVLVGANLQGDHIQGARLGNIRLIGARLQGAHLQEANLRGAQLQYAHLAGAFLQGADLSGANLTGADLTGAKLQGTTLTGIVWSNTTCPDGTNSDNGGGTCTRTK